jgi:hypothetical protein
MTWLMAIYVEVALALALAAVLFAAAIHWGGGRILVAAPRWTAFGWMLIALSIAAPIGWRASGRGGLRPASVEVWGSHGPALPDGMAEGTAAEAMRGAAGLWTGADGLPGLWLGRPVAVALVVGLLLGVLVALGRYGRGSWRLRAICAGLPVWKRVGRVRLCVSNQLGSPFAARSQGQAFIVVPTSLLVDPGRLRLVIAHEVAHHRRGDLLLAPCLAVLRALFFWNPLLVLWERALRALEDLACDSAVLARARVTPSAYGQALLWAVTAVRGSPDDRVALLGGRAMASKSTENLRRRILMLNRPKKSGGLGSNVLGICVAAGVLLGSWAVRGAVNERRLGAAEVAAAAARIEAAQGFSVLTHERVVTTLNRRLGTAEGRAKLKQALVRMQGYRSTIDPILVAHKVPRALIAVGLQESGFDNQSRSNRPPERQSAGIWQLIPNTGRAMGLSVTPALDERLDPKRATEAAAALLAQLYQRFGDWPVAIAAYNAGPKLIEPIVAGLSKEEARRRLLESDTEYGQYLVGVMASVILCENPALVD